MKYQTPEMVFPVAGIIALAVNCKMTVYMANMYENALRVYMEIMKSEGFEFTSKPSLVPIEKAAVTQILNSRYGITPDGPAPSLLKADQRTLTAPHKMNEEEVRETVIRVTMIPGVIHNWDTQKVLEIIRSHFNAPQS